MSQAIAPWPTDERHTGQSLGNLDAAFKYSSAHGTPVELASMPNAVLRDLMGSWDVTSTGSVVAPSQISPVPSNTWERLLPLDRSLVRRVAWVVISGEMIKDSSSAGNETFASLDAVQAISEVKEALGLPVRDVLEAAGVARRTYYSWRKADIRPRLASQGRIWRLLQVAQDLRSVLGGDLPKWVAAEPGRRHTLLAGDFDRLMSELVMEQSARRSFLHSSVVDGLDAAGIEELPDRAAGARSFVGTPVTLTGTLKRRHNSNSGITRSGER